MLEAKSDSVKDPALFGDKYSQNVRDFRVECSRDESVVRAGAWSVSRIVEDRAVTGPEAGKEKAVVECWVGPPQLTTHASIVSKLFSLPGTKIKIRLLAIEFFVLRYNLCKLAHKSRKQNFWLRKQFLLFPIVLF